MNILLTARST